MLLPPRRGIIFRDAGIRIMDKARFVEAVRRNPVNQLILERLPAPTITPAHQHKVKYYVSHSARPPASTRPPSTALSPRFSRCPATRNSLKPNGSRSSAGFKHSWGGKGNTSNKQEKRGEAKR